MTGRAGLSPFSTETVWNAGLSGTGSCDEGQSLTIGHEAEWCPQHLLLFQSHPTLSLTPCIVVATDDEARRVRRLVRQAVEKSTVARLLGDRLTVAADVRAVPEDPAS